MDICVHKLQNYTGIILKFTFDNVMKSEMCDTALVLCPTAHSGNSYRDLL